VNWLREAEPDIACLQELKAGDAEFPAEAIRRAGYHAVWHGEARWNGVAIVARWGPVVTRMDLPGDTPDGQCRYLEAAVNGLLVASIYAPNGNPQPGPKFDYKLAWLKRLNDHAAELYATRAPVVLAGDYNVVRLTSTSTQRNPGIVTPCCSLRTALRISAFSRGAGPTPFARSTPKSRCTRFGTTCGIVGSAMAVCVSTTFSLVPR
jgi:exonuclease III